MLEYFTSIGQAVDLIGNTELMMKVHPEVYGPRLDAIKELRDLDDGTLHRGNEFRRVASLVNVPVGLAIKMEQPNFFQDKKAFYRWLSDHPEFRTYEKKGGSRPAVTYTDGVPTVHGG